MDFQIIYGSINQFFNELSNNAWLTHDLYAGVSFATGMGVSIYSHFKQSKKENKGKTLDKKVSE